MKISRKANIIEPSLTRDLFNRALRLDDVINLTLGDPDFAPLPEIQQAACRAILDGKTHYSANAGLLELRQEIAKSFNREYHLTCDPKSEIIVTVGGMEALYLAISSIVDPSDEVIVFAPYYVNYVQMIRMNGGVPVILDTDAGNGFSIDLTKLERSITSKTVAIIINSPCNPTGHMYSAETLAGIAKIAKKHDLYIISDEVYKTLIYDGQKHHSVLENPEIQDHVILIDSISKKYSMTGWRLGWAIGNSSVISAMTKMQENVAACAPLPSQYAVLDALKKDLPSDNLRNAFQARRDCIYTLLSSCKKISVSKPSSTFYIFVGIQATGMKSVDFALALLEKEHVAVVPGRAYGASFDNYIRIAFTQDIKVLETACEKIKHFVEAI